MHKKYYIIFFYLIFIFCAALSFLYIPDARTYDIGSEISLLILFLPLAYALWTKFGSKLFFLSVILLSVFALSIEYIGLTTGWPYGGFLYTGALGYKIFGILPWTVGLSWTPLMLGSVSIVYGLTASRVARIALPVVLLVIFDMLLDPAAVHFGLWKYIQGGFYYGVPLQNFFGWIFSGTIGSLICFYLFGNQDQSKMRGLWYSFFLSIVFWTILVFASGLILPSMVGAILIISCIVIYLKNNEKVS